MTAAFVPVLSWNQIRDAKIVLESKHKVVFDVALKRLTIEFLLGENNSCVFRHTHVFTHGKSCLVK